MWACGRGAIAWGRGKTVLGRLEKAGPACILDQQHVEARDGDRAVLQQPHARVAARVGAVVTRQLDEVDLVLDRDRTRKVGEEDEARLQQRDEQQGAVLVVARDLHAQLLDAAAQLVGAEEDLANARVRCCRVA